MRTSSVIPTTKVEKRMSTGLKKQKYSRQRSVEWTQIWGWLYMSFSIWWRVSSCLDRKCYPVNSAATICHFCVQMVSARHFQILLRVGHFPRSGSLMLPLQTTSVSISSSLSSFFFQISEVCCWLASLVVMRKVLPEEKQCSSQVGRVYSNSREEVLWCSCDLPRRKWKETTWKDSLTLTYSLSPQWRTMSRLHSGQKVQSTSMIWAILLLPLAFSLASCSSSEQQSSTSLILHFSLSCPYLQDQQVSILEWLRSWPSLGWLSTSVKTSCLLWSQTSPQFLALLLKTFLASVATTRPKCFNLLRRVVLRLTQKWLLVSPAPFSRLAKLYCFPLNTLSHHPASSVAKWQSVPCSFRNNRCWPAAVRWSILPALTSQQKCRGVTRVHLTACVSWAVSGSISSITKATWVGCTTATRLLLANCWTSGVRQSTSFSSNTGSSKSHSLSSTSSSRRTHRIAMLRSYSSTRLPTAKQQIPLRYRHPCATSPSCPASALASATCRGKSSGPALDSLPLGDRRLQQWPLQTRQLVR